MPLGPLARIAFAALLLWPASAQNPLPPLSGVAELPSTEAAQPPRTYAVNQAHPQASDDNPGTEAKPFKTIGNEDCVVRNCLIANNEGAGIFYEISYGLRVEDNVIVGNGFDSGAGAWGANGGVSLSSSPHCVVERNLIVGNREGFQFREQIRSTTRIDESKDRRQAIWNHDSIIRNNTLAYNQDAQIAGWFDVQDLRYWPTSMRKEMTVLFAASGAEPRDDIAAPYKAKGAEGAPGDLSLEQLNLAIENNLYAVSEGQKLVQWGCKWRPHKEYVNIEGVQRELAFEKAGRVESVVFKNVLAFDLRVAPDSPALKMGCYPKGDVPDAKLGVIQK